MNKQNGKAIIKSSEFNKAKQSGKRRKEMKTNKIIKSKKTRKYDWIWLCWCVLMARQKKYGERNNRNKWKETRTNTMPSKWKWRSIHFIERVKLGEKNIAIDEFYLDFSIVCELSTVFSYFFSSFSPFLCLLSLFVCMYECVCLLVCVACKTKCRLFSRIYRTLEAG